MDTTLFTIPGFLSAAECRDLISFAEMRGFTDAPVTTSRGFVMMPDVRNNTRVIVDDHARAEGIWSRLSPHIPARPGAVPVGINERFRFYRYEPGQCFRWHRDGAFCRNDEEASELTFMIYLNGNFGGGHTEFDATSVAPKAGTALVFAHRLSHQGAPVTRGTKYVLRSDVMFRREAKRAS